MSFFAQPCTPFSDLPLSSCLNNNPQSCCLRTECEQSTSVDVNMQSKTIRYTYESGAVVLVNEDFQLFRSSCRMWWFRDRFSVMHVLD